MIMGIIISQRKFMFFGGLCFYLIQLVTVAFCQHLNLIYRLETSQEISHI